MAPFSKLTAAIFAPTIGLRRQVTALAGSTRRLVGELGRIQAALRWTTVVLEHDREFLPAALELLDTPPSPVALALLLLLCVGSVVGVGWSYFGRIDIHVVAPGKIQPSGRSKVIQPLETGKVSAVHVDNGSHVEAGDLLIELDPTESGADRDAQERDLEAAEGEVARRTVEVLAAPTYAGTLPAIAFPASVGPSVRQREESVLAAELRQLLASQNSLKGQLDEKLATKQRLNLEIEGRQRLIALSRERASMRYAMDAKGAGSRALIIEALQQLETQLSETTSAQGQLIEADASIRSFQRKIEETVSHFIAEQADKQADMERKRDRLAQELVKASSKSDHTRLRSPIAGSVQQLAIESVGQVVTGGQSLMTIVPTGGDLEIEALIANRDIGFVEQGQPVAVKVEAFPFGRYGAVQGTIQKVSRDAVDDKDAGTLGDAESQAKPRRPDASGVAHTQNLVYPATIKLAQRTIDVDGKSVALAPGMAVSVEIKTGRRRIIDYVMSPLREVASTSGHER